MHPLEDPGINIYFFVAHLSCSIRKITTLFFGGTTIFLNSHLRNSALMLALAAVAGAKRKGTLLARWVVSNMCYFYPETWGNDEMIRFDGRISSDGLVKSHQLDHGCRRVFADVGQFTVSEFFKIFGRFPMLR